MITLRKFLQLKPGTRKRKLIRIIGDYEQLLSGNGAGNKTLFIRFFEDLERDLPDDLVDASEWHSFVRAAGSIHAGFAANRLRHLLMDEVGTVAADWDEFSAGSGNGNSGRIRTGDHDPGPGYRDPAEMRLDLGDPPRLPALPAGGRGLYLDDLRSPFNVGAVIRTAAFFNISPVILSPDTPKPGVPRLDKTSMGTSAQVEWGVLSREDFIQSLSEVAIAPGEPTENSRLSSALEPMLYCLETGGENIAQSDLSQSGWLILGNEELGVHPELLDFSTTLEAKKGSRIVSIPGAGKKASLNVSVAFGIAAAYWCSQGS